MSILPMNYYLKQVLIFFLSFMSDYLSLPEHYSMNLLQSRQSLQCGGQVFIDRTLSVLICVLYGSISCHVHPAQLLLNGYSQTLESFKQNSGIGWDCRKLLNWSCATYFSPWERRDRLVNINIYPLLIYYQTRFYLLLYCVKLSLFQYHCLINIRKTWNKFSKFFITCRMCFFYIFNYNLSYNNNLWKFVLTSIDDSLFEYSPGQF